MATTKKDPSTGEQYEGTYHATTLQNKPDKEAKKTKAVHEQPNKVTKNK